MNMIQIGVMGVIGVLLASQFKSTKAEYGIYISVAVSIVLFACIADRLDIFIEAVRQMNQYFSIGEGYLSTILKMIGVTYIVEFCCSICKDAGHQTIAVQIELFAKLTILAMGMPVLLALMETIREFLS